MELYLRQYTRKPWQRLTEAEREQLVQKARQEAREARLTLRPDYKPVHCVELLQGWCLMWNPVPDDAA